jgi:acetyl-CoA carboxylase beta subunit
MIAEVRAKLPVLLVGRDPRPVRFLEPPAFRKAEHLLDSGGHNEIAKRRNLRTNSSNTALPIASWRNYVCSTVNW